MNTISFAVDDKLSEEGGVIAVDTEVTYPPLSRTYLWCIYEESLSGWVISRSCHEIGDI